MGLKTIVREELKIRGLFWDRKAPQATPNKHAARILAIRQKAHALLMETQRGREGGHKMPGSLQM